jgi:glycosyltransferase involved in cell wall biosynthesis
LVNYLNSIILNTNYRKEDVQICVSDNCSTDLTETVVRSAQEKIDIVYRKNESNIGMARNFLEVVNMADGEYVWIIGDDDLLMPTALEKLIKIISQNSDVDLFYINEFDLAAEYVLSYPQPFDTIGLPNDMKRKSLWKEDGKMDFFDLISPKISGDFLNGISLSVFRRRGWIENAGVLDSNALYDERVFSNFDNTYPHIKIFAKAFAKSKAYFHSTPLSVCLSGAREWAPMSSYIRSVRLVNGVDEYRKNGLPYLKYLRYKNRALRAFIPDMLYMYIYRKESGYEYIDPMKLLFNNCLYPEFYLSLILFPFRFSIMKYVVRGIKTGKFYPQAQ